MHIFHTYVVTLFKHWIAFCRCSRNAVHSIYFSFRCNSYDPWTPTKCDSIRIFTSFYNKVCRGIANLITKTTYLSDFKRTKSRTASTGWMTNCTKPPCDPVQIIRTKDWYFESLIIVNTATSYHIYMSFTFEMDKGKGVLAIDIYNFIRA